MAASAYRYEVHVRYWVVWPHLSFSLKFIRLRTILHILKSHRNASEYVYRTKLLCYANTWSRPPHFTSRGCKSCARWCIADISFPGSLFILKNGWLVEVIRLNVSIYNRALIWLPLFSIFIIISPPLLRLSLYSSRSLFVLLWIFVHWTKVRLKGSINSGGVFSQASSLLIRFGTGGRLSVKADEIWIIVARGEKYLPFLWTESGRVFHKKDRPFGIFEWCSTYFKNPFARLCSG